MMERPTIAPQGHGPLGGTSSISFGTQPVEPSKNKGRADILANVTPERNQTPRKSMASACSTRLIVIGRVVCGALFSNP